MQPSKFWLLRKGFVTEIGVLLAGACRGLDPRGGSKYFGCLVQGGLTLLPTTSKLLVEGTGGSKYFTLDCDLEGGSKLSRGV